MQAIYNHSKELVAYQFKNVIIHPVDFSVLGLVLGNCVFDKEAKVLGKLFHHKVLNLSGEVLATKDESAFQMPSNFDNLACIQKGWQILLKIKDHSSPWVIEKKYWAKTPIADALYQ